MALLEVGTGYAYSTIQAAVNACPSGGTVRANPTPGNVYNEALLINNKRIRLVGGGNTPQAILIAGAGGGAAPALQVTGSGGVIVENFRFSNIGSAAVTVVQMNVAEDWISRCSIAAGAGKRALLAQYGDNLLLHDGARGLDPSCPGQVIMRHVACVNMTASGLAGNANNGDFKACLAYNNNGQGFVNSYPQFCCWNFGEDGTAIGALSQAYLTLAQIAFTNYGAGDFSLALASSAWVYGVPILPNDINDKRRLRVGAQGRIYAGPYTPFPAAPAWLSGTSSIRAVA